ncbi:hypothetical protein DKX38_024942 [Salix brachista]|uniref:Uncharacterized protein n=1 Tax=Salix brachista TaxID=2182728 RepID=A0A5N5JT92_9ROSI|nr:hypothetical protein DKX38_024942 [Salix brachista]
MAPLLRKAWRFIFSSSRLASLSPSAGREFRSDAALEAISKANEEKTPNIVLYNYPSFSGAFSALFAHLFHSRRNLPCLILPFSSVEPFRIVDFRIEGLERCYLLDFIGPRGFASTLSRQSNCEVICFDHRKSVLSRVQSIEDCGEKVRFTVDVEKSSSTSVYEYFSKKIQDNNGGVEGLLKPEDQDRVEMILKYIEDMDLRRWSLPDIRAFNVGIGEWRSKFNYVTNPYMFEEVCALDFGILPWISVLVFRIRALLEISPVDIIEKGNSNISSRWADASKLMDKVFKVRLGRGFYGECLGVRADGNSHFSDEIGKALSVKSAAAGLRPIGAVVYMLRNNLKMCLRSIDSATDTSEVAKAYGGGGSPSSSSFIIRMDEYNQWLSVNAS